MLTGLDKVMIARDLLLNKEAQHFRLTLESSDTRDSEERLAAEIESIQAELTKLEKSHQDEIDAAKQSTERLQAEQAGAFYVPAASDVKP